MSLESATYIHELVITNPVGASDFVSQGDDHIRLVKSTLQATFPNVEGEVTASHTQLNVLAADGAGAGMLADIAAIGDPGADRLLGWDESGNNAIAFTLGSGLTTSGTSALVDSTIVPLLASSNTFTGATQIIQNATPAHILDETDGGVDQRRWSCRASGAALSFTTQTDAGVNTGQWLLVNRSATTITKVTFAATEVETNVTTFDLNATATTIDGATIALVGTTSCTMQGTANAVIALTTNGVSITGVLTTPNTSASEIGYKGVPQNLQDGNYTLVLTDAGKTIYKASGGAGETVTIPANASVAFPVGTQLDIVNNGGGDLAIAITTDTLSWVVGGATGSRTLGDHGWAVIKKVSSTEWFISGANLT